LRKLPGLVLDVLFLDCSGEELARRFSETRRRHPLAQDRPVSDGIARERELLAPLRRWADYLFDTTSQSIHDLRRQMSETFRLSRSQRMTLSLLSFGFARGLPRDVDLVFDMRFLRNPHWVDELRPMTGLDSRVQQFIAEDPAFEQAFAQILQLLTTLLPHYQREGKSYLTVAFGCTGGRHRSVFVAERMSSALREPGYNPVTTHRDLGFSPAETGVPEPRPDGVAE
jgi:RNase adapter protein RapZ